TLLHWLQRLLAVAMLDLPLDTGIQQLRGSIRRWLQVASLLLLALDVSVSVSASSVQSVVAGSPTLMPFPLTQPHLRLSLIERYRGPDLDPSAVEACFSSVLWRGYFQTLSLWFG